MGHREHCAAEAKDDGYTSCTCDNAAEYCTNCGKPEPETGWYATFGIWLKPEWFCTKECFEEVADNEGDGPFTTDEVE